MQGREITVTFNAEAAALW